MDEELHADPVKTADGPAENQDAARVLRCDRSNITGTREGPSGGLIVRGNLRRTGVLTYHLSDGTTRRELVHPDEAFHPDARESFKGAPITEGHPGRVSPDNWATHAVGHMQDAPSKDGDFLSGDLHLQDGKTIAKVKRGDLREISCAYECRLDHTPGEWKGEAYDAVQRGPRGNHVALGPRGWGRAGPDVGLKMDGGVALSADAEVAATFDSMTEEEKARLAKLEADLKATTEENAKLRKDAADVDALRAKNALLELENKRVDKAKSDADSRSRTDSMVQELTSLREDARRVFSTTKDPTGAKWPAEGKSPNDIRLEVFNALEPNYKADTGIDPATLDPEALAPLYQHVVRAHAKTDTSRASMLATTIPHQDARKTEGEDDDEPAADCAKARKDMIKEQKSRFIGAADRRAADAKKGAR